MVITGDGRGQRAAVRAAHLDRFGLDHEIADRYDVAIAHHRAGPAPLQSQGLSAARVRLDLRADPDDRSQGVFGLVLREGVWNQKDP